MIRASERRTCPRWWRRPSRRMDAATMTAQTAATAHVGVWSSALVPSPAPPPSPPPISSRRSPHRLNPAGREGVEWRRVEVGECVKCGRGGADETRRLLGGAAACLRRPRWRCASLFLNRAAVCPVGKDLRSQSSSSSNRKRTVFCGGWFSDLVLALSYCSKLAPELFF